MKKPNKFIKVLLVVFLDLLLLGACLCTFAYFHHVRPKPSTSEPIVIEKPITTAAPAATPDANDQTDQVTTEEPVLTWKEKFADKFSSDGSITQTENTFISENTHVTISRVETSVERDFRGQKVEYPVVYYVADIYITDVEQFATAFPKGEYMQNASGSTQMQIINNNGIIGINGDNYGSRQSGLVIRNGVLYRESLFEGDIMVLYYDGTMEPIFYNDVNLNEIVAKGPFQAWSFGPVLLKDGQIVTDSVLPDYIRDDNPRTAVGYYEPGHYCMVVVEGRSDDSLGADVNLLSEIFYNLGCESAYNLDGGATSAMVFNDEYVNERAGGGRHSTDTLLILDPDYTKEGE
ncbi:MAG: phosphodiester glycosidase family protein [Eubacteriales bacterium]